MRICSTSIRQQTRPIREMGVHNCNDQIAARAFGAVEHVDPTDFDRLRSYDCVIATMWKTKVEAIEPRWMDVLHRLKDETNTKVALFQEAETAWPTTRPWDEQKSFLALLWKVDLFLTHNQRDIDMWGQLRQGKPTYRWKTCLDLAFIEQFAMPEHSKPERPIIFGSSYDDRANGIAGLIACKDTGNPLWHQNRSVGYHDRNEELPGLLGVTVDKEIPAGGWHEWLINVSGAYLAVHPMPAAAAGRDQICFAALGIPCIGSVDLDIQVELFPLLAVNPYDVAKMKRLVRMVLNDEDTYTKVRLYAQEKVQKYGFPDAQYQANLIKQAMGWEV